MEESSASTSEQAAEVPRHAAEQEIWPGSHQPLDDAAQAPDGFPIKGNADSGLYHVPGSAFYERTVAEVWFSSADAAEAAGFQLPPSQRKAAAAPVDEPAVDGTEQPATDDLTPVAEEPAAEAPAAEETAAEAPAAEPEPEPAALAAETAPEPEPVASANGYVSSFRDTASAPVPAAGNPLVKRLLAALGAGAIAFLVLRKGLRRKG